MTSRWTSSWGRGRTAKVGGGRGRTAAVLPRGRAAGELGGIVRPSLPEPRGPYRNRTLPTPFTAPPPPPLKRPPVYRGFWKGTLVAIKVMILPAGLSNKERREKMAVMEAAISSSLSHPNIVQV
jgi:hypothetical protein